ncbi:hypothetical protein P7C65_05s2g07440 [Encephalitozoon intestinalis]|nr:hypothetical protein GPK93_05g07940 [Encephalitozoon intestinalis]
MERLEALNSRIQTINTLMVGYDLVDFLSDEAVDMNSMGLDMVVSTMKDVMSASRQFQKDGSAEYLERCKGLQKKIRRIGFLRLNEIIYRSVESLMVDPSFGEFVRLLEEDLVYRTQVKILQSRKVECLRKSVYIKNNREFLFRSMVRQELCIFLKLFPWESERLRKRLKEFKEERPLASSGLFECFSFSVLKEYFESCGIEELESLKKRLFVELKSSEKSISGEAKESEDGDFYAGVLMLVSVRHYLSSKQNYSAQNEVIEV